MQIIHIIHILWTYRTFCPLECPIGISMKKVKIKIYGRVQGVFFRVSAMEKCREFNVSCEPINMPDGTVEISAQGKENDISNFIEWCKKGPIFARVDKVEIINANQ